MIYEVISEVTIRREPRVVEYKDAKGNVITNAVGKLSIGTHREVYSTATDKNNATWGRISESDAAGIAQWVCIKGLNRTFMKLIEKEPDGLLVSRVEFEEVKSRLSNLETWARIQGYKG